MLRPVPSHWVANVCEAIDLANLASPPEGEGIPGNRETEHAMPLYSRHGETAAIMGLAPVIPVLTVDSVEDGLAQAKALIAGGLYAIEVTLRTPSALAAIAAISEAIPDAVAGAGTIVTAEQIDEALAAGARFLVSPGATPALAKAAAQSPVPFLPGCATASEAMTLRELGFRALKLFPAEAVGGVRLLASLAAPLPDLSFCPTGGIDLAKAPDYLKLPNVACVGGSWMLTKASLKRGDYAVVETLAREAARLARAPG
jgi:2-dehydro-3-deoxyphosphogluconate aldolase/(4S)-4-hydroxy-2-oxoglutarate aldolase